MFADSINWEPRDRPEAVMLPEARNLNELYQLVCIVRAHLAAMTGEWWSRHHFQPTSMPEGIVGFVDQGAEVRWHGTRAAKIYRDNLRVQALQLWRPGLPPLPEEIANAESDIANAITP